MAEAEFEGAKLALFHGDQIVVYLRDDVAHIPYPACWDLAGGGREGDETPQETVLRETFEEFGLTLDADRLTGARQIARQDLQGRITWFFAAFVTSGEIASIRFGDEGQRWQMMTVPEWLQHADGVPHLQTQTRDYIRANLDKFSSNLVI